ncbi:MAG: CoA transferase [Alphaproteobacteria bacterium]|nr:CoA transferase [Alphaproteobacteria bacterium]
MATKVKNDTEKAKEAGATEDPTPEPRAILQGLRVIEGSAFVAAPLGGMTLAQLGAEVIRFDPIGGGLDYDRWPVTEDGTSLFWAGLNKGKRSIAIDLAHPEGVEIATRLITARGSDRGIFLTNFPARGWLDYERLKGFRDDLIMINITGDHTGRSEVDYTVNAAMGFPLVTGAKDGDGPVNHVLPAWDAMTGLWAACGILAAERHRRTTGEGQLLSLALADVAMAVTGALGIIGEVMINGEDRERHGNDLFGGFGRDFETRDATRIMVVGLTGRQWQGLLAATGLDSEMAELGERLGLDLSRQGNRFEARGQIADLIAPWIKDRDLGECAAKFDANGVCWGPYQTFRELVESDPRCSTANPLFTMMDQPGIGSMLTAGSPLARGNSSGGAARIPPRPAPRLGQDTDAVLAEVLGMSEREIGSLHDSRVVAGP